MKRPQWFGAKSDGSDASSFIVAASNAAAVTNDKTVVIDEPLTVSTANVTIPAGVTLRIEDGGRLSGSGLSTMTISRLDCTGLTQVFGGRVGKIIECSRGHLTPQMFGAVPSPTTTNTVGVDSYQAFRDALDSSDFTLNENPVWHSGLALYVPQGRYRLSQTIHLKRAHRIYGDFGGYAYGSGPVLLWPAGVTGIVAHAHNTGTDGSIESPATTGAAGARIEGLVLIGVRGGVVDGQGGHGIRSRTKVYIANCMILRFSGNGIHMQAGAGLGIPETEGNINVAGINAVSCYQNDGHGFYADGADSNAISIVNLDCSSNGGWGIYDSSFLGNTYVACHTADNDLGAYKADGAVSTAFIGCYSESGQPPSDITAKHLVIGGTHAANFTIGELPLSGIKTYANSMRIASAKAMSQNLKAYVSIGYDEGGTAGIMSLRYSGLDLPSGTPNPYPNSFWTWKVHDSGYLYMDWANQGGSNVMELHNRNVYTVANGRPRDGADTFSGAAGGNGVPIGLPLGYLDLGGLTRITRTAVPTIGSRLRGDIVWNSNPSTNGIIGWVCTVAGTPGTWLPMGYTANAGSATVDLGSIAAGAIATFTITVTGAAAGDTVYVGPPSTIEEGLTWCAFVSAADTVTVRVHNTTAGAIDPASATWKAKVVKG